MKRYYYLMTKLKIIPFFLLHFVFSACVDENLTNISEMVHFTPTYSLPVGTVSYSINDYFESIIETIDNIDTLIQGPYGYVEYEDDTLPNILEYVERRDDKEFDFSTISDQIDNVTYLMFRINLTNGFATEASTQVYFAGAGMNITDSLFREGPRLIPPGDTNEEGVIVNNYTDQIDIELAENQINNLPNVRYIIITGKVYTVSNDRKIAKFYREYSINVQIGIRVGLEMTAGDI